MRPKYILISATRDELDIGTAFFATQKEAHQAMIDEIIAWTDYESVDDIVDAADSGECSFSDNDAWAETNHLGTCQWSIIEIPMTI